MATKRVVLVTGVSRDLGARFARSLATDEDVEVVGLDVSRLVTTWVRPISYAPTSAIR